MPPAVAAAAVSGAAALGGGILSSHAAGQASEAQARANAEALAYQRQKDAEAKAKADAREADQRRSYNAYLQTYFPDDYKNYMASAPIGKPAGPRSSVLLEGNAARFTGGGGTPFTPPGVSVPAPMTLGSIAGVPSPVTAAPAGVAQMPGTAPAGGTLGDLANGSWSDWKRYGVGQ